MIDIGRFAVLIDPTFTAYTIYLFRDMVAVCNESFDRKFQPTPKPTNLLFTWASMGTLGLCLKGVS